jgi:hypothetical protein
MKSPEELVDAALAVGREVAGAAYGPEARVEFERSATSWHGVLHRHIFEQQMSVWKHLGFLDLITDAQNRVVGFVDHEAYRRANYTSEISRNAIRCIVADNEFLPPGCRPIKRTTRRGPEGGHLAAVTVEGPSSAGPRRWLLEINIARRVVASIRPLEAGEEVNE